MKKIVRILIVIFLIGICPIVNAENFSSFKVRTSMSNEIDITKIPSIYVLISVPGEEDYREIELTRENLYNYETSDMPNTDIQFDSAYIAGDRYGNYTVTGSIQKNNNTATLNINVLLKNTSTTATTTTTTTKTSGVVTSEVSNSGDDVIIIDDNGKVETTTVPYITLTTKQEISENAKARIKLYKIVFAGIGIGLAFVIIIILVKIVKTNNLM